MNYDGGQCAWNLNIVTVGVRDRWRGASVARWLGSRGHCGPGGYFPAVVSVCRLGSP